MRLSLPFLVWMLFLYLSGAVATAASPMTVQENGAGSLYQQSAPPSTGGDESEYSLQPSWVPLPADHQHYIDQLLDVWEKSSSQIRQCTCDFRRWDYDPEKVNWRDPRDNRLAAAVIMTGQIRYAAPDKALYESTQAWVFGGPPEAAGGDPKYEALESRTQHEKWICDGKSTYEFDFNNRKLYEVAIPPEMQGNGLANSPLPFLFGAKKELILSRYWVRVVTPPGVEDEYWLEAYPKRVEDARNYKMVQFVIAREDFLPKSIHIFAPTYDPAKNPTSRVFAFGNRKINSQLDGLKDLMGSFIRPSTPIGWDRVDMGKQALSNGDPAGAAAPLGVPSTSERPAPVGSRINK